MPELMISMNLGVHRQDRTDLASRLTVEYAGSVPPGQVIAAVLRADHALRSFAAGDQRRLALCEELARHRLVQFVTQSNDTPTGRSTRPEIPMEGSRP